MQSWVNALRQEGVEPPIARTDNRRRAAVEMLRALGPILQDRHKLRRLCVWLAPSLYTVGAPDAEANSLFATIEPLSRQYVSMTTDAGAQDNKVTQLGEFTLVTGGRHLG